MKSLVTVQYAGKTISFNTLGWFNASQAALNFHKSVHEWLDLFSTQQYIEAFKNQYGETLYLKTKRGKNGGTWLHPKLAIHFAQWLDIDFSFWFDEQIEQLLHGNPSAWEYNRVRHLASITHKALISVLKLSRELQGKCTESHHYINEAKLINWAITGEFISINRNELTYDDLNLLIELRVQNLILLSSQCSYNERKATLESLAQQLKANNTHLKSSLLLIKNHKNQILVQESHKQAQGMYVFKYAFLNTPSYPLRITSYYIQPSNKTNHKEGRK